MIELISLNAVCVVVFTAFVFYRAGHKNGGSDERMAGIIGRPHGKEDSRRVMQEKLELRRWELPPKPKPTKAPPTPKVRG